MSELVLGIKISADGKQATAELGKVETAVKQTGAATKSTTQHMSELGGGWAKFAQGSARLRAEEDVRKLSEWSKKAGADLQSLQSVTLASTGQAKAGLEAYAVTLGKVYAAYIAVRAAASSMSAAVDAMRDMERLKAMMDASAGSASLAAENLAFVESNANKLGISMLASADGFASLTAAARGTALEGAATRDIFTAVTRAAAAMGKSAADTSGIISALSQMISKGTVSMEELRQQLGERLPGAMQMAARAMGVTTQELDKMVSSGSVTAVELLPKLAKALDETYSGARFDRINNEIERLNNAWTKLKANLLDSDMLASAVRTLTGAIESLNGGAGTPLENVTQKIKELRQEAAALELQMSGSFWTRPIDISITGPGRLEAIRREISQLENRAGGYRAQEEAAKALTPKPVDSSKNGSAAAIMAQANALLGMSESKNSAALAKFLNEKSGTLFSGIVGEANAWCARYVSAVLNAAGAKSLNTASAKSYAGYGKEVWGKGDGASALANVMPGDIAVFTRKGGGGHVGFVKAADPNKGLLDILGGNQSNAVSIAQRSIKDLIAIRRPTGSMDDLANVSKNLKKINDEEYRAASESIARRQQLEDAAGRVRVAQHKAELDRLQQAADEAGKKAQIRIDLIVDQQGLAAAQKAITQAEKQQADYIRQMYSTVNGKTVGEQAAEREIKAIEAKMTAAKEAGTWEEKGAELVNERAVAEQRLAEEKAKAGGQDFQMQAALRENHAKYEAMRQQGAREYAGIQSAQRAADAAAVQNAANVVQADIKTRLAYLTQEREAAKQALQVDLQRAGTFEEKQAVLQQTAQAEQARMATQAELSRQTLDQEQAVIEARKAGYAADLASAMQTQASAREIIGIKENIARTDADLAVLAETRKQAEIDAASAVNSFSQQSAEMKAREREQLDALNQEYQKQIVILAQLKEAAAQGMSGDQIKSLNQMLQDMPSGQIFSKEALAQAEAMKGKIKDVAQEVAKLASAEERVREQQLRENAYWDQLMGRMREFQDTWSKITGEQNNPFEQLAVQAAALAKNISQIGNVYEAMQEQWRGSLDTTTESYREMAAAAKASGKLMESSWLNAAEGIAYAQQGLKMMAQTLLAMRSEYEKGTAGYEKMTQAAETMMGVQRALSLVEAVLGVVHQATSGDPYTAIPRMIGVAAMMASLGMETGLGGGGKGGYKDNSGNSGGVLGDQTKQSDSIAESLRIIKENSSNDLNYSAAMLAALQNIESALNAASASIFTNVMPTLAAAVNQSGVKLGMKKIDLFSGFSTEVTGGGIYAPAQYLTTILKKGFEGLQYVDITKSFKAFGASLSKKTKEYFMDLDVAAESQFTKAIRGIVEALKEGGKAFDLSSADFATRLKGFKVDFGKIDLLGLTGEEAQKAIAAAFSNMTDALARKLVPGINKFQQMGESSATTFFRVADGINRANGALAQLGIEAISYKNIIDKQKPVDQEIFKQSYLASQQASQGLKEYIQTITGTADELLNATRKFIEAENLLKTANLNPEVLQGGTGGKLIGAVGGLDNFLGLMQGFNDNFLTEAQRFAGFTAQVADGFAKLGVAMPASGEAFYQLVTGIDTSTDAGKKLLGGLLQLADGFAKVKDQVQGIKDKYADILNPFGKIGAQIDTVIGDFNLLIGEAASRSQGTIDALGNQLKDALKAPQAGYDDAAAMRTTLNKSLNDRYKALHEAQEAFDAEMAKPEKKRNGKKISQWLTIIRESKEAINDLTAGLNSVWDEMGRWQDQINQLNADYAGKTGVEKARADMEKAAIVADANTVMTDTLAKIFEELAATVEQARQKIDAVKQLRQGLQTQIAQLQGPAATRDLMTARSTEAMGAIDAYIARLDTGMQRNVDTEIQLIQTAQQSVMNKYNAELAAVQALESNIQSLTSYLTGLATQIAQLQGPQAVAGLAGQRYTEARQAIGGYIRGVRSGDTRDYAKETQLLQDGQAAVMEKYNAEMALLQEAAQVQAQALQDQMNAQIEAINAATQAQVDAINARLEAEIEAINQAAEAAVKARQKEFDAANKAQRKANDEVIKAQQKGYDAANKAQQKLFDQETKAKQKVFDKELKALQKTQEAKAKTLQDEYDAAVKLRDAIQGVADYARGMALSAASPLSPEQRLAESGKQYQELLAKAKSGDAEAIAKLSGASDAYLEAAKNYYGSSSAYADIFKGVQDAMTGVGAMNSADPDSIQSRIDALREAQADELDRVRELQQDAMDLLREQQQERMDAIREAQQEALDATREAQQEAMEATREAQRAQLEAMRDATQAQIKAAQEAAKAQIDAVQKGAQAQIEALQKDVAQRVKDLSDPDKNLAMKALKEATIADLKELQRLAEVSRKGAEEQAKAAEGKTDVFRSNALLELGRLSALADSAQREAERQFAETQSLARGNAQKAADSAAAQLASLAEGNRLNAAQAAILNSIAGKMIEGFVPVQTRAKGGFTPAGYTLVGEEGPELVRFTQPSMVYTAAETRQILAAPTTDKTEKPGLEKGKFALVQPAVSLIERLTHDRLSDIKSTSSLIERLTNNNRKSDSKTFIERDRQSSIEKIATLQRFSKILEKVPAFATGGMANAPQIAVTPPVVPKPALRMAGEPPTQATVLPFVRPANPSIKPAPPAATRTAEDEKSLQALDAIKRELKAIVTTQSNANPQLIDKLAGIEARLDKMERLQRMSA